MIKQGTIHLLDRMCAMLTSYKKHALQPVENLRADLIHSSSCIPDPNGSWDDLYKNLRKFD
jgi:hypothetical protein